MDTSYDSLSRVRKVNKQEMERCRRARMNTSLDKLRNIMHQQSFISDVDYQKMEKAEILDKLVVFCEHLCSSNVNTTYQIPIAPIRKTSDQNLFHSPIPKFPLRVLNSNEINVFNNITDSNSDTKSEYRILKPSVLASLNKYQTSNDQKEDRSKIWKPYE